MDDVIVLLLSFFVVFAWMGVEVRVVGRRVERFNLVRSVVFCCVEDVFIGSEVFI